MEEISIIICLEEKKQRLKEYQTDFCEAKKSQFSDQYISKVKPKQFFNCADLIVCAMM